MANLKSFLGGSSAAEASGMAIVVGTSGGSQLQDKSSRETAADKTGTVECEYMHTSFRAGDLFGGR